MDEQEYQKAIFGIDLDEIRDSILGRLLSQVQRLRAVTSRPLLQKLVDTPLAISSLGKHQLHLIRICFSSPPMAEHPIEGIPACVVMAKRSVFRSHEVRGASNSIEFMTSM
ncbi:MAG: hypothetical protein O7G85_13285 [Planctomycetota bacterium]|nr:hypothetical protein [Planctomycetota bacterium]